MADSFFISIARLGSPWHALLLTRLFRREIAESVISGRKSVADIARLYNVSQPTVSRIVAEHRS
ncbi:MAG: transposase family protein [Methylocella sp.]